MVWSEEQLWNVSVLQRVGLRLFQSCLKKYILRRGFERGQNVWRCLFARSVQTERKAARKDRIEQINKTGKNARTKERA
jgi:hypothetical protein